MSIGSTSNNTRVTPRAPDLGSFPLDHFRECVKEIESYYVCLKTNNYLAPLCRDQTRDYLQCRMDRGLMTPTEIAGFGIPETEFVPTRQHKVDVKQQWLRNRMNQVTVVWEKNYKREDLDIPDGFERPKDSAAEST